MSEKQNSILTIIVIFSIILVFTVADFIQGDRLYSEKENRVLAAKPKFSKETLWDGSFAKDYEKYVSDQFVRRDKWIAVKTRLDILMQKSNIKGVYLGKDGYLIEQHRPENYTEEQIEEKLELLKALDDRWNLRVMLVPTADNIITDKLPENAPYYDETELLARVRGLVGKYHYIDVYGALKEHVDEELYYRTDHHWTSLAAYYGYVEWAETVHVYPLIRDPENRKTVTEDFLGTLHSRVDLEMEADKIEFFPQTDNKPVDITFDFGRTAYSFYEPKHLETKNKYGYFLDDNHAFVEIHTSRRNGRKLFVLKDSYANSVIPMLAQHYEYVYVVDPRYFNGKLFDFMEQYGDKNEMDVLVLYNCIHFLEDFNYIR